MALYLNLNIYVTGTFAPEAKDNPTLEPGTPLEVEANSQNGQGISSPNNLQKSFNFF